MFSRVAAEEIPANAYAVAGLQSQQHERLLGAVTANITTLDKVDDEEILAADGVHDQVMYILTLGSRSTVRRRGIASMLLHECIEEASRHPRCGAVRVCFASQGLMELLVLTASDTAPDLLARQG